MHPVLIPVFGLFNIHTYGMMIAIGFLVGMQLATRQARRVDLSPQRNFDQFVLDLTFWILIVSMIGSRVLFIIVEWQDDYAHDPLKIFRIWEGGLVFYGGFIASVLFAYIYTRMKGRDFFQVSDVLIPSVALGHFFGRIGCFAAGCCWGLPADPDFALAIQFPADSLVHSTLTRTGVIAANAEYTNHLHPVQLYESFGELMIFFILLLTRARKRFHGQVLLTYLFLYPILRTTLEFYRGDHARGENVLGTPLSTSQFISVLIASIAVVLLIILVQRRKKEQKRAEEKARAEALKKGDNNAKKPKEDEPDTEHSEKETSEAESKKTAEETKD